MGKKRSLDFISRQISSDEHTACRRPAETRAAHATEPARGARKARGFLWGKHPARNRVPLLWAPDRWGSFTSRQHKRNHCDCTGEWENELLPRGGWDIQGWETAVTETQQEPGKRKSQALTVSLTPCSGDPELFGSSSGCRAELGCSTIPIPKSGWV